MKPYSALTILGLYLASGVLPASAQALRDARYGQFSISYERHGVNQYIGRGPAYTVALTPDGASLQYRIGSGKTAEVALRFHRSKSMTLLGEEQLAGKAHYYRGSGSGTWQEALPMFRKVRSANLYPGIDVLFHGNLRQFEYDLVVAPQADPAAAEIAFVGVDRLQIHADGGLGLFTQAGEIRWAKPVAYQEIQGKRVTVASGYVLKGRRVKFRVGDYDRTQALVIDPVLSYSTLLGGEGGPEYGNGIAVDAAGNTYVVGTAVPPNFPVVGASSTGDRTGADVFVAKFNPAGTELLFSTLIGGRGDDQGVAIALDNNEIYITGQTNSTDFPTMSARQGSYGGGSYDAFVSKLSTTGALLFSTYHGGSGQDLGKGISARNGLGAAAVIGWTDSLNFPLQGPLQGTRNGPNDAFVSQFQSNGVLKFSTYLGGSSFDEGNAVALGTDGTTYATGNTYSIDFPKTPSTLLGFLGATDCFVTKLNVFGNQIEYSQLVGGSSFDGCAAIAVDGAGFAYFGGTTSSDDIPLVRAVQASRGSQGNVEDMFLAKLDPIGSRLELSTYLGGRYSDVVLGLAVDSAGRLHFAGRSPGALPIANAFQPRKPGSSALVLRATNNGAALTEVFAGMEYLWSSTTLAQSGGTLYAGGNTGFVYRSNNNGNSWTTGGNGTSGGINRLVAEPSGTILVATTTGLRRTSDGVTFANIGAGLPANPYLLTVATHPGLPNVRYAGLRDGGLYRSIDGGATFTLSNTGMTNLTVHSIAVTTGINPAILAATDGGLARSTDGGATWTMITGGLPGGSTQFVVCHPTTGDAFVTWYGRVYASANRGVSWQAIGEAIPGYVYQVATDPNNASVLFAATAESGVWRSLNRGANWELITPGDYTAREFLWTQDGLLIGLDSPTAGFVGRIDIEAQRLDYLSYLGGSWYDAATALAVDSAGSAYVTGYTGGLAFPTSAGAWRRTVQPSDAFVAKINPDSTNCGISLSPRTTEFLWYADTSEIGLATGSGCNWTAQSSAPWVQIYHGQSGVGSGTIRFRVPDYNEPADRSATISAGGSSITIVQRGTTCRTTSWDQSTLSFPRQGGIRTLQFVIAPGCQWSVQVNSSWLSVLPSSGVGPAAIRVTAEPHAGDADRSGEFAILRNQVPVSQRGRCDVELSAANRVFGASGGTGSVMIRTGSGCQTTATDQSGFVNFTGNVTGSGDRQLTFTVPAYAGAAPRSGEIRVGDATLRVTQNVPSCTLTLTPSAKDTGSVSQGSTFRVNTDAGCGHEFSTSQPWIRLGTAYGDGPRTFRYSVENNYATTSRTGQISSGLVTHTVTQRALHPTIPTAYPAEPAAGFGFNQKFRFTFADGNGVNDLGVLNILINSALDGRNGCYLAFVQAANTLFLVPDNGEGLLPGIVPGGAGLIVNSQCAVHMPAAAVNRSGNVLTLDLDIAFSPAFSGNKVIYQAARDATNNSGWIQQGVWQVPGPVTAPATPRVVAMEPQRDSGSAQSFQLNFDDPDGRNDLNVLNILINNALDGRNACYLAYVRSANTLYLVPDNGEGLLPGIIPGGTGSTENSQCRILAQGSSVSQIGTNGLRVWLNVEFLPGFLGNRLFYLAARDAALNNSGWQVVGSYTVQ